MLLEGFVAVIALGTIMIATSGEVAGKKADEIYSLGLGQFLTSIIGPDHARFATTFAAMALTTFIFDTIDVGTRLGRYILQELFRWEGRAAAMICTGLTVLAPLGILMATDRGSFLTFWTLFGTSNQLLAGLTLLAVTVWLKLSRRPSWYTFYPTLFVLAVTLVALAIQGWGWLVHPTSGLDRLNGVVAALLFLLAVQLIAQAIRTLRAAQPPVARVVE